MRHFQTEDVRERFRLAVADEASAEDMALALSQVRISIHQDQPPDTGFGKQGDVAPSEPQPITITVFPARLVPLPPREWI